MIRADEIDPTIRAALAERMRQISAKTVGLDPLEAEVKAAGTRAWYAAIPKAARPIGGTLAALGISGIVPPMLFPHSGEPMVMTFLAINVITVGLGVRAYRMIEAEATRHVSPSVIRMAPQLLSLSRAEQLYCEALAALIDTGDLLGEAPQREILSQLNELLANFRKLELTASHYRAAAASQSWEQIQHELAVLIQRRDALEDTAARETAEQAVRLCEERLERARKVEPLRERAQAQQDLVLQTLESLRARLGRIKTVGTAPPPAEMTGLRETVDEINLQTRSVEEAVNEVMMVGAG